MKRLSHSVAQLIALAAMSSMPAGLGQQQTLATQPGSAYVRTRDRHSFWAGPEVRKPRTRAPEQIAKHAAKLWRRRGRWIEGLANNPCISAPQYIALTGYSTQDIGYESAFIDATAAAHCRA